MTVDFALRLASAAARVLAPQGGTVLIGKDTRVSGYMFESALEAGFVAAGVDVLLTGPLPTPAIAVLTKKLGADFGIVISASHNPYHDNGIKFFDAEGEKLSDAARGSDRGRVSTSPPVTRDSRALGQAKNGVGGARRLHGFLQGARFPRAWASRTSRSSSTRRTAPPTRSRRASCPISAPTSCPSAARRTAATSTTAAARRGRIC